MKKKIIIHIEDLVVPQESILRYLLQNFCVEHIEILEDSAATLLVGGLRIEERQHQAWLDNNLVNLTPMEFDVLHLLARRPGRVFSQREIYELVAPDSFDSSWTGITSIIYKLRHKLNADLIQTVYGKGYRFLPP